MTKEIYEEVFLMLDEQDKNLLNLISLSSTSLYAKNIFFYIFKAKSRKYQLDIYLVIYAPKDKFSEYKLVDYFIVNPSITYETISFLLNNYIFKAYF